MVFRAAIDAVSPDELSQLSREQIRSRRKREVRARTISVKRMTKTDLRVGLLLYPVSDHGKPRTRGECQGGPRPCPYVSCKWHLYLDVSPRTGAIKLNYPDLEPDELAHSCTLDVADRGGETLEEVGALANLTRERIRQLEVRAMAKLAELPDFHALDELRGEEHRAYLPRPEPEEPITEDEVCP